MTIRFADTSLASQAFTVTELPDLTGKATTSDGTATFDLPVTLDSFTIVFTESGTTFAFTTGGLDPINTLSGVFQRLQNLGYLPRTGDARPLDIDEIRAALTAFKIAHAGAGPSATSASTDSSTSAAPDGGGPQTSASTAAPDADTNAPDDVSPSSSGLGDDGRLDDATSQQLLAAHGS
jgi:hypothetical protein